MWGGLPWGEAAPLAALLPSAHPRGHLASLEDQVGHLRGDVWGGGMVRSLCWEVGAHAQVQRGGQSRTLSLAHFSGAGMTPRAFTPRFINASLSSRSQSRPRKQLLLASPPRLQIPSAQQNSPLIEAAVPGAHQSPSKGRLARIAHQPGHCHHSQAPARPRGAPPKTQN